MKKEIADIRSDYQLQSLNIEDVSSNAFEQFGKWWGDAINSEIYEVNAMTLATATREGKPSARIVLLKDYDDKGFVFFTNYNSHKGSELAENHFAALVFFWKELERQIRIEGSIEKVSAEESDAYFYSRPVGSRIGAWASPQSTIIDSRSILDENVSMFTEKFGEQIPRPEHWGGYRIIPAVIEFWQGRSSRLHDRIQYSKEINGNWIIERLAP